MLMDLIAFKAIRVKIILTLSDPREVFSILFYRAGASSRVGFWIARSALTVDAYRF